MWIRYKNYWFFHEKRQSNNKNKQKIRYENNCQCKFIKIWTALVLITLIKQKGWEITPFDQLLTDRNKPKSWRSRILPVLCTLHRWWFHLTEQMIQKIDNHIKKKKWQKIIDKIITIINPLCFSLCFFNFYYFH